MNIAKKTEKQNLNFNNQKKKAQNFRIKRCSILSKMWRKVVIKMSLNPSEQQRDDKIICKTKKTIKVYIKTTTIVYFYQTKSNTKDANINDAQIDN